MQRYLELERYQVNSLEDIAILYDRERRRLVVRVDYDYRTLTDWPILYHDGRVGWNHPERLTVQTRARTKQLLRQMRAAALNEPYKEMEE